MKPTYRFYSFVAGLYLSPLQRGLQTGHAISEMQSDLLKMEQDEVSNAAVDRSIERLMYNDWATDDKTIVILDALNCAGVVEAYNKATEFCMDLEMPVTIFHEDIASLNGAPTATGLVVPDFYYDAREIIEVQDDGGFLKGVTQELMALILHRKMPDYIKRFYRFERKNADGEVVETLDYEQDSVEYNFIKFLKSYRLAQS